MSKQTTRKSTKLKDSPRSTLFDQLHQFEGIEVDEGEQFPSLPRPSATANTASSSVAQELQVVQLQKEKLLLELKVLRELEGTKPIQELKKRVIDWPQNFVPGECVDEKGLKNGDYSFVFTSPECLLNVEKWRSMLRSEIYQSNLFCLVTDEAHVVPKWGHGNAKERKAAFRESFGRIGDLRSLMPVGSPVLALTATATKEVTRKTVEALGLKNNYMNIRVSPNRSNIFLYKERTTNDLSCFSWIINSLRETKEKSPKCIIYCKRQVDCGYLYRHFMQELGENAYVTNTSHESKNSLIGMYHSKTLQKQKDRVINDALDEDGICRVVLATTALGMGINIPNVRYVIHYGPPKEMDYFAQEIGRAGRDGLDSISIMYYRGAQTHRCSKQVLDYARKESVCLREQLLASFEETVVPNKGTHKCCMVCHLSCKCEDVCPVPLWSPSNKTAGPSNVEEKRTRKVSKGDRELLKALLSEFKTKLANKCPSYYLTPESTTGFSDSVIASTVKSAKYIFTFQDVLDYVPVFSKNHAIEILLIFNDIFEDIQVDAALLEQHTEHPIDILDYDLEYCEDYLSDSSYDSSNGSDVSMDSVLSGIDVLQ
ncbi:Werner syndrome ATP-dependent helicase [Exaiptasia diaphana]|nr:Werner syndrome ATP-dependent helicase [Exaiptasia diaphana]